MPPFNLDETELDVRYQCLVTLLQGLLLVINKVNSTLAERQALQCSCVAVDCLWCARSHIPLLF